MKYRSDIDGLRAIAVLSVLAYHVMPWILPGGYIGVDVFFVISGYLITSILWRQLEKGTFSFVNFYAKRIRRLFPALFAVILVSSVLQLLWGLPWEIYDFGYSSIAAVFYFSNHYFLSKSSYFDEALESNPLLHTWSLSVEEQFYILFPALLVFIFYKMKGKETLVLGVLLLFSLVLSEYWVINDSAVSFYVVFSRFWQFLIGGLLALWPLKITLPRAWGEFVGWTGLGMLLYTFFFYSGATLFPGLNAVVPTLATVLLLYVGKDERLWISKSLSVPVARFIGKISYSLYLWHWPLIVFYKLEFSPDPSSLERIGLIIASFVFAYVSWRYIEEPFRKLTLPQHRTLIYTGGSLASLALLGIGGYFITTEGMEKRYSDEQLSYVEYLHYDASSFFRTDQCFITSKAQEVDAFDEEECLNIDTQRPNVLIVGDSHAAQYHAALTKGFPNYSISQVSASGCRPLINYKGEARCTSLIKTTFEEYIKENKFDAVILAGRWEEGDITYVKPTVEAIAPYIKRVIVLGPIIEYSQALPRLLAKNIHQSDKIEAAQLYNAIEELDHRMAKGVIQTGAEYFSVLKAICPEGECSMYTDEGVPMQFDSSHLTLEGAMELVDRLVERGLLKEVFTYSHVPLPEKKIES